MPSSTLDLHVRARRRRWLQRPAMRQLPPRGTDDAAPPSAAKVWMTTWLVPAVLPLLLLLAWDVAVRTSGTMLIPSRKRWAGCCGTCVWRHL